MKTYTNAGTNAIAPNDLRESLPRSPVLVKEILTERKSESISAERINNPLDVE